MAEDALQQTFLQLHLKCDTFEFDGKKMRKVRPWLYTIATNQAIDLQRKNRRHKMASLDKPGRSPDSEADESRGALGDVVLTAPFEDPLQRIVACESSSDLQKAMCKLSEAQQQVLGLVYFQGLKYREAADVLGIPDGTVKSRLHAAILALQRLFAVA